MHAAGLMDYGDPDVLRVVELPEPVARAGEVVVRVVAATVNPTDAMMRAGLQAATMTDLTPPYVPGMEFAGYVHALGDDASSLTLGHAVMGVMNPRRPDGGAHAEYVRVPTASVAALAGPVDVVEAATVPMNGLTAKMAIEALDLGSGATLLVTGGAGAVGGYVIQLAKHLGFTVVADAKPDDVDLLRRFGADEVVPRGGGMQAAVRTLRPDGVDGAIDAALVGDPVAALVRGGGTVVSLRLGQTINDPRVRQRSVLVMDEMENSAALAWLSELLAERVLTPRVAVRLPVSEAAEAHRLVERGGLRGRVVLVFTA